MTQLSRHATLPPVYDVDNPDHTRYTEGDCHMLAQAIADLTSWRVGALLDEEDSGHVFVVMPDGDVLDIAGVSTLLNMRRVWYGFDRFETYGSAYSLRDKYGWSDPTPDQSTVKVAKRLQGGRLQA